MAERDGWLEGEWPERNGWFEGDGMAKRDG